MYLLIYIKVEWELEKCRTFISVFACYWKNKKKGLLNNMSCTYSATCIATVKFSRRLPGLRSSYGTSSGRKECRIAHSASPSAKLLLKSLTSTF